MSTNNKRKRVRRRIAIRRGRAIVIKAIDWAMNLLLCSVALFRFVIQLLLYVTFSIPSDSMAPTLIHGDQIMVDKTIMGARIFDFFGALKGEQVKIRRIYGRDRLKNNDIIVFNFPYRSSWDSIAMDIRQYYVKRCAAIPGDTVEIHDCKYYINGVYEAQLNNVSAERLSDFMKSNEDNPQLVSQQVVVDAFPNDSVVPWTVREFGPMIVPSAGYKIQLDEQNATIFRNYIEWETGHKMVIKGDSVYLGGVYMTSYMFSENYYFVAGDDVFNSQDSRYFGLLPEQFIVGKVVMILYSEDKIRGKKRKERYFKHV